MLTDEQQRAEHARLMSLPVDNSERPTLSERVRLSGDKLARRARKFLTLAAVYAERDAHPDPLNAPLDPRPRYPSISQGSRQSPCRPFEAGTNCLPGMEEFARQVRR